MSSPTVLQRLGTAVKDTASKLKSLPPDESEAQALKEKQANVDAVTNAKPTPEPEHNGAEPLHMGVYGSRPGEKRLDTSYLDKPTAIKAPLYDKGGDVSVEASRRLQDAGNEGLRSMLAEPDETPSAPAKGKAEEKGKPSVGLKPIGDYLQHRNDAADAVTTDRGDNVMQHGASNAAPVMPVIGVDATKAPVFDEGGDVDVNDGKHQVAILKDGEKVLTPEQADQYDAEHTKPNTEVASSQKPKPYGQVIEDRAAEKAKDMVAEPGAKADDSNSVGNQIKEEAPKEEEKPKVTYGHILADQWLQRNGMPSMDSLKAPKELNQGSPNAGVEDGMTAPKVLGQPEQTPAAGYKPIVQSETAQPAATAPTGKDAYHAQMKMYDSAYQTAMDKAAATNDPQYKEQAARIQEAKLAYEKSHPWGASESAHPGVLGKIGHVAQQVLSRAPISAPIAATIPGSEGYRAAETRGAEDQVKEASAENANENKNAANSMAGYHQVSGGAVDPQHPELGPQVAFENEKNPKDIVYQGPITPKTNGGGDKAAFEKTLAKIGSADVADATKQRSAIEQAHTDKKITDEEYNNANAYLGSNANAPATQASAAQIKEDQKIAAVFRGKTLVFQNPDGSRQGMTYEQAKAEGRDLNGAMAYTPMAADKLRTAEKSYHNALQMFSTYEKDINKAKLSTDDERGMQILTSHISDEAANDYLSKAGSGFLDLIQGEPLTGYSKKAMGGIMTKDQYDKMSPEARTLVADYFQAMLSHFQSIKDTQGSIPRNPEMIRTEMGAIPLPYLNKDEAGPAFDKYFNRMHNMNVDAVRFGTPERKEEEAAPKPPEGATHPVYKSQTDKTVIGYMMANGQYQPATK